MSTCNNAAQNLPVYGQVDSVESFGSVDGPGLRYIIFLKGCPLRCLYCHNPETWGGKEGEKRSSEEMLQSALRYRPYWKGGGGITVSGGEPLLQMDFVTDLFRRAKAQGISTCIDTSGAVFIWPQSKSLCGFVMSWCQVLMMMRKVWAKLVSL